MNPANLKPVAITYDELVSRLWPWIGQHRWAQMELHDLWMMGAPVPNRFLTPKGQNERFERRILFPNQFRSWWENVCKRHQAELTAAEALAGLRPR